MVFLAKRLRLAVGLVMVLAFQTAGVAAQTRSTMTIEGKSFTVIGGVNHSMSANADSAVMRLDQFEVSIKYGKINFDGQSIDFRKYNAIEIFVEAGGIRIDADGQTIHRPKMVGRLKALKEQADSGDTDAQVDLAVAYFHGDGVGEDIAEAVRLMRAAAADNAMAQRNMGMLHTDGVGVEENLETAFEWFQKSALGGDMIGQAALAEFLRDGRGTEKDLEKSLHWFEKSSEQGHSPAMIDLGHAYKNGLGTEIDPVKAAQWYRRAAEEENSDGQYNFALSLLDGDGVEKDEEAALEWLNKAATRHRHPLAYNTLGDMHGNGIVVGKNPAEAVRHYRMAAEGGAALGEYNLGLAYRDGTGIEMDLEQALVWFRRAQAQGYEDATRVIEKIEKAQ